MITRRTLPSELDNGLGALDVQLLTPHQLEWLNLEQVKGRAR